MTDDEQLKPWDQRPDETSKAYLAFKHYRDAGATRSKRQAWRDYADEVGLESKIPHQPFWSWAKEHEWDKRVLAWDRHLEKKRQQKIEEQVVKAHERLADNLLDVVDQLIKAATGVLDPLELSKEQVSAITEVLDRSGVAEPEKLVLQATHEHSGDVDHQHEHSVDYTKLTDEQIQTLLTIREQAEGEDN